MNGAPISRTLAAEISKGSSKSDWEALLAKCLAAGRALSMPEAKFNQNLLQQTLAALDPGSQVCDQRRNARAKTNPGKPLCRNRDPLGGRPEKQIARDYRASARWRGEEIGARPGDLILEVDGRSTSGIELGEVVQWLRGADGTEVHVALRNKDENGIRNYTMTRAEVPFETVKGYKRLDDDSWNFLLPEKHEAAYIKIDSLVGSTAAELATAWRKIDQSSVERIVIDMRMARHAEIHHTSLFADQLLPERVFGVVDDGRSKVEMKTTDDHLNIEKPIIIVSPASVSGPVFCLLRALKQQPNIHVVCPNGSQVVHGRHLSHTRRTARWPWCDRWFGLRPL